MDFKSHLRLAPLRPVHAVAAAALLVIGIHYVRWLLLLQGVESIFGVNCGGKESSLVKRPDQRPRRRGTADSSRSWCWLTQHKRARERGRATQGRAKVANLLPWHPPSCKRQPPNHQHHWSMSQATRSRLWPAYQ